MDLRLERLDERFAFVGAVGKDDGDVLGVRAEVGVQESHDARRTGPVGTAIRTTGQFFERYLADAHHAPHVDHNFRMLEQEIEHLGIAIDHPCGQAAINARVLDNELRRALLVRPHLSPGNGADCFVSGGAAGGRLTRVGTQVDLIAQKDSATAMLTTAAQRVPLLIATSSNRPRSAKSAVATANQLHTIPPCPTSLLRSQALAGR